MILKIFRLIFKYFRRGGKRDRSVSRGGSADRSPAVEDRRGRSRSPRKYEEKPRVDDQKEHQQSSAVEEQAARSASPEKPIEEFVPVVEEAPAVESADIQASGDATAAIEESATAEQDAVAEVKSPLKQLLQPADVPPPADENQQPAAQESVN